MPKFRKKPVVIEAEQVGPNVAPAWYAEAVRRGSITFQGDGSADIHTLEGTMHADSGDWIIQGVKGEIYPCKPDIFAATYEPADTPQAIMDPPPLMAELTPEQEAAFKAEWERQPPGNITLVPMGRGIREHDILGSLAGGEIVDGDTLTVDPGPAIGEHLTDIDADEEPSVSRLYARIRDALETIVDRYSDLEAQLQAEGEHTAAAQEEIDRLHKILGH
jgi:hypothetical protein